MNFPLSLPPVFPSLTFRIPRSGEDGEFAFTSSVSATRERRGYNADSKWSDIDLEETAMRMHNVQIAIHGQAYLRPPGLEPLVSRERFDEQGQDVDALAPEDETFNEEDDVFIGGLEEVEEEVEEEEEDGEGFDEFEDIDEDEEDLDADIEQPSDASYLSGSPDITPARVMHGHLRETGSSPITPDMISRGIHEIEALSELVEAIRARGDESLERHMDLEDFEDDDEDLDADVEDMDEEAEDSLVEGDSMEL